VQAYSDVFEALFHVMRHAKIELAQIEEGGQYDEKYLKELGDRASAGYNAIRKAAVIGTFVLSPEAAERLTEVEKAFDDPHYGHDPYEQISSTLDAVTKAIEDLRPIAKKDLQLD